MTSLTPLSATVPQALSRLVAADGGRPLVTFYDDASGERVELSVATYANWVAKTASLLQDELEIGFGGLLLVDLPVHWLGPVWLGAAWTMGLRVTTDRGDAGRADGLVTGPRGVGDFAPLAVDIPVVACSLRPLGARFADPLPDGVHDFGVEVWSQPDAFVPYEAPGPDDGAWEQDGEVRSQRELLAGAAAGHLVGDTGRLLTDANPCSGDGLATFLEPLVRGGSSIWVAQPDPAAWEGRYADERATARLVTGA